MDSFATILEIKFIVIFKLETITVYPLILEGHVINLDQDGISLMTETF